MSIDSTLYKTIVEIVDERVKEIKVTREDFNELKSIVKELARAQEEFSHAQRESEKRISALENIVERLAQAQRRTEKRVEELAQAQRRTEKRVEELTQAQKELAQAQKRTEESLQTLIREHKETRRQVGGLSTTIGYRLEDEAFKALPELLKRDFSIDLKGRLKREFIKDNKGKKIEINIIGEGLKDGKKVVIIGEGKSQLSRNDVDRFIRKKLKKAQGLYEEIFPLIVTYMISEPDVEEYVKDKGIALYYSYDF